MTGFPGCQIHLVHSFSWPVSGQAFTTPYPGHPSTTMEPTDSLSLEFWAKILRSDGGRFMAWHRWDGSGLDCNRWCSTTELQPSPVVLNETSMCWLAKEPPYSRSLSWKGLSEWGNGQSRERSSKGLAGVLCSVCTGGNSWLKEVYGKETLPGDCDFSVKSGASFGGPVAL